MCNKERIMKKVGMLLSALVLCGLTGDTKGGEKTERPLDREFLIKVASCSNAEIQVSKLARSRSESTQVKDYATTMVKDHQAAYDQLGGLLKNRKIGVLAGLEKETRDELSRLGKLQGTDFDRAYLQCAITEHKKAIAMFEAQVQNGKEDDIRGYAKENLPTLRKHLAQAEELAKTAAK